MTDSPTHFARLMPRRETLHWFLDTRAGPFDYASRDDTDDLQRVVHVLWTGGPGADWADSGLR